MPGEGAQAPRHLLPEFGHKDISLGSVVIRRHREVLGEPKVVVLAAQQAVGQCMMLTGGRARVVGGLADRDQGSATVSAGQFGQRGRVQSVLALRDRLADQPGECRKYGWVHLPDNEEYGVARLVGELASDLKDGGWQPLPAWKVLIPKPRSIQSRRWRSAAPGLREPNAARSFAHGGVSDCARGSATEAVDHPPDDRR